MTRPWWTDGAAPVFARARVPGGVARRRQRFEASAEYARRWPPAPEEGLGAYELSVCSQNGEDGVLAEILHRLGPSDRTFVEFGVETGEEGNCVALADHRAWTGWFFEADAASYRGLAAKYAWNDRVHTGRETITAQNVDEVFTAAGVPPAIDVLSIDIDGADVQVWQALGVTRPRVVVIEYNCAIDPALSVVARDTGSGWDGTQNHGASLGAALTVAGAKGYDLVHLESAGVNAFFVDTALGWTGLRGDGVTRRTPNYFGLRAGHPGFDPSLAAFREF